MLGRRARAWAVCVGLWLWLGGLCSEQRPRASGALSWSYQVVVRDAQRGQLDIAMSMRGANPTKRVCLFMDKAGQAIRQMRWASLAAPNEETSLPPLPEDNDCFALPERTPAGWVVRYQLDLRVLAQRFGDPDYAENLDGTFVWNEQAVLVHPVPFSLHSNVDISVQLPPGMPLVTPWELVAPRDRDGAARYRSTGSQHDGGSYVLMGSKLHTMPDVLLGPQGSRLHLTLIDLPRKTDDQLLRRWIEQAGQAVASFYGPLMPKDVTVSLVPLAGSRSAGIYGTVLRPERPSVVIFYGAEGTSNDFANDWLATHELFHIGNPQVAQRVPWLVEGFTTYFEGLLRARNQMIPREQAWAELASGFQRHCQPEGKVPLRTESARLKQTHRYQRVYWGGACLAFGVDLAIRKRALQERPGKREKQRRPQSLDEVLRGLRRQSLEAALSETDILRTLDEAAGQGLATRLLDERQHIPVETWLAELGVTARSSSQVTLRMDAPLASVRDTIMARSLPPSP